MNTRIYLFLLWLACLSPVPAQAGTKASPSRQTMVYEVYAGGVHAIQATLDLDITEKGRYDMVLKAYTRGFLGSLVPWSGTFESHGWALDAGDYRPETHKSTSIWRGETDISEYIYNRDRSFKSLTVRDFGKKPKTEKPDPALTNGTTDVLTATLSVMDAVMRDGRCAGQSDVFDGKRRFTLSYNPAGESMLAATKYNVYDGTAFECTAEVTPVAGLWHEKTRGWLSIQEQGRARGTMPTLWMAKIGKDGVAIPVKIMVKTAYGTLFMHLAEYRSGTTAVSTKKRAKPDE